MPNVNSLSDLIVSRRSASFICTISLTVGVPAFQAGGLGSNLSLVTCRSDCELTFGIVYMYDQINGRRASLPGWRTGFEPQSCHKEYPTYVG